MRILHVRTLNGPNVYYADRPVIEIRLDLEDLANKESHKIPGFIDRLLAILPGIRERHCGLGRPSEGTSFGHIVEHVALELTDAAGIPVNHGKTRQTGSRGIYNVAVSFRNEAGMRSLLETTVEFVQALVDARPFPLEERLAAARCIIAETELGPSTRALVQAAELRSIPWRRIDERNTIQLGYGKHRKFISAAITSNTSCVAVDIAGNKELTKRMLRDANISVPPGEQLEGCDYRVLVVNGKVVAASDGQAKDVTDLVDPSIARMCERAARIVGLDVCGIDLVTEDIGQPLSERGGIVEVNASPGLRMHLFPSEGEPRDVASAIIESIYPAGQDGRIPIVSITGTKGKTTTTRLVAHMLAQAGSCVGMTTTDGIYIRGECVANGDMTGPASAQSVLADPCVDIAVFETARDGIVRRGLGYDWADVAVLTNIEPDHIEQDGITSIEDILDIKKLVAHRVRKGGTLVLNCDDERLAALPADPAIDARGVRIVYFSLRPNCPQLRWHMAQGHAGFFVENDWIMEGAGPARWRIVPVADVPITMGGRAEFQLSNLLGAVAAARAVGVGAREIRSALIAFNSVVPEAAQQTLARIALI